MSGGTFDYKQFEFYGIAEEIEELSKDQEWSFETQIKFLKAAHIVKMAAAMITRIDWLIAGDDSEDTFHKRWEEEKLDEFFKDH